MNIRAARLSLGSAAPEILLALFAACLVGGHLFWLAADALPPRWDEAHYLRMGLVFGDALFAQGPRALASALVNFDPLRPPLIPALTIPLTATFGRSADAALGLYTVGFVVLAFGVYGIGRQICSKWCGLLAAVILCGYPGLVAFSRRFFLDFGTTVVVTTCLYFLLRSDGFRHLPSSVAAGGLFGAAVLSRTFAPVFLVGPFAISGFAAWRAWRSDTSRSSSRLGPAILASILSIAVAAPWYARNLSGVAKRSIGAAYGAEAVGYGPQSPVAPSALASFFLRTVNAHLTIVGLIVVALAIVAWRLRSRDQNEQRNTSRYHFAILVTTVAIPYLFFMLLRAQDIKNITPVLGAAAVLTALSLSSMRAGKAKTVLIALVVSWSLFSFSFVTFEVRTTPAQVSIKMPSGLPSLVVLTEEGQPRREGWPVSDAALRIAARARQSGSVRPLVGVVPDHPLLNYSNLRYFATLHGLSFTVDRIGPQNQRRGFYRDQLSSVDYIIVKTGDVGPRFVNPYTRSITSVIQSSAEFRSFDRIPLGDGSVAILYERASR